MSVAGQKGIDDGSKYGHGKDSIECVRSLSISREFVKQGSYDQALPYWQVVFNECPLASKNIYLDGVKIYKYLIEKETDDVRTDSYLDTLMLIYDQRIKYFGERSNVRSRQGIDLLRYGRSKTTNIMKAYNLLDEAIEIEKSGSTEAALASYFSSSIILYQNKYFTSGKVIQDYLKVNTYLYSKLPDDGAMQVLNAINENLIDQGPDNCDTLSFYLSKEIDTHKGDSIFLRTLIVLLENRKCTESEIYANVLTTYQKLRPNAQLSAKNALLAYKKGDYNKAIEYYRQALTLENNQDNKAGHYFGLASCFSSLKNKPEAREMALKSIEIKPGWGEPYLFIGQLYASSKDDCASIKLPNSIYWIAVDMFIKAKNVDPSITEHANTLISTYSKYYPNREEAFFENIHSGNSFTVGCWINEITQARFN